MTCNQERAIWARDVVEAFQSAKGEPDLEALSSEYRDDAITDLVADLGHLADWFDVNFIALVEQAVGAWSVERRHLDDDHMDHDKVTILINGEVRS